MRMSVTDKHGQYLVVAAATSILRLCDIWLQSRRLDSDNQVNFKTRCQLSSNLYNSDWSKELDVCDWWKCCRIFSAKSVGILLSKRKVSTASSSARAFTIFSSDFITREETSPVTYLHKILLTKSRYQQVNTSNKQKTGQSSPEHGQI